MHQHDGVHLPPTTPGPDLPPLRCADTKSLRLFGSTAQAWLLPERAQRAHQAAAPRPALAPCRAAEILAHETIWSSDNLAATPNRFPFLREQMILWPKSTLREPDLELWRVAHAWVAATNGVGLVNSIGAAATIARAHMHLSPERGAFLRGLALREAAVQLDLPQGTAALQAQVPFQLLAIQGEPPDRAMAMWRLSEQRLVPACTIVIEPEHTWLMPRRTETPGGAFPHAIGAAELWGRWCFVDQPSWQVAEGDGLERELTAAGVDWAGR